MTPATRKGYGRPVTGATIERIHHLAVAHHANEVARILGMSKSTVSKIGQQYDIRFKAAERRWNADALARLRQLADEGLCAKRIALRIGDIDYQAVRQAACKYRISIRSKTVRPEHVEEIRRLGETLHMPQIARHLGLTLSQVYRACRRHDIRIPRSRRTVYTDDVVSAARGMRAEGMPWSAIGRALNVNFKNLSEVVRGTRT